MAKQRFTKGDKVIIMQGRGTIINIDNTTYSIPMYTIELTTGKWIGTYICVCENEMNKEH